jgi:5-methylcytosine-specific restriction endonuclease McrA
MLDLEKRREAGRRWRAAHLDKAHAIEKVWRKAHPENKAVNQKRYSEANREKVRAANRRAYTQRKEEHRLRHEVYRHTHPEKQLQWNTNRRARVKGAKGSHTHAEWQSLLEASSFLCWYCGCSDKPLTRDHIIPLKLGGSNTISNIVPACRSCNSKKGHKLQTPLDSKLIEVSHFDYHITTR